MDKMKECKHGNIGACRLCMSDKAPKCKHGKAFYCGFCGLVRIEYTKKE